MIIRTYSELIKLPTFEERYQYLRLNGIVGQETFGFDRYLNQVFYRSAEWRKTRDLVIVRDGGCDLGIEGREIERKALIHHMNPLVARDITEISDLLLNPEYLITTTFDTHNAIHYGNETLLKRGPAERTPNDTCPWKSSPQKENEKW